MTARAEDAATKTPGSEAGTVSRTGRGEPSAGEAIPMPAKRTAVASDAGRLADLAQTTPPASWRQRIRHGLEAGLHRIRFDQLYVRCRRVAGAVILMYHSVAGEEDAAWIDPANHLSPERFEAHLVYLSRRARVVSLSKVVQAVERGETLPAGTVALAFDDGYLDNLHVAAPLLSRYGLPATLFLPTAYVASGAPQWIDAQYAAFRARRRDTLCWPVDVGHEFDLRMPETRLAAYRAVAADLLGMTWDGREAALAALRQQLGSTASPPPLTMNWNEVRALRRQYPDVELGVHTREHVDLSRHPDRAADEVVGCCDDFAHAIGERPRFFAYPYNRVSPEAVSAVRTAGLCGAVAGEGAAGTGALPITASADPLRLPRVEAPASTARLGFVTSGAHPGLLNGLCGRRQVQKQR